jgi:carbon monoxide dehydrogenase subunit G
MVNIKSEKKEIHSPAGLLFSFLSDFNNFQDLMPEQIVNWKSENDSCSFTIKGMSDINMKIKEKIFPEKIKIISHGKNLFTFELLCFVDYKNENSSMVCLHFNAELNPMLAMMTKKPLQNLVNIMIEKLQEKFKI